MSTPRRLIASFVLLLLLPAAAVVWLGVRLVAQDRQLEAAQMQERRNSAADCRGAVLAHADRHLGPGLMPSAGTCFGIYAPPGLVPRCTFMLGGGQGFATGNITMPEMAMLIGSFPAVNTTVLDRTGLAGSFDVRMTKFVGGAATGAATAERPAMFTALEDMLGLRLDPARGMVDVLVVDHAERPTED